MTRVFINGVEVSPEDLEKIEIRCDILDQILSTKMQSNERNRGGAD